jgi:histidyl-tRNA synthetase
VLELNSIGDEACRPAYRAMLIDYLEAQSPRLRDEHRDRFRENPLRVLDCKEETCRDVAEDAPKIADHLCGPCKEHFEQVRSLLESGGVAFALVPTLVRGLDYYTRTAFEWTSPSLPPGQASLGGGGRYDGLAEVLGGPPTPGVGFALGLERILLTVPQPAGLGATRGPVCFVIGVGEGQERALELVRLLRAAGVPAEAALEVRPLKAQLRMADRSGARFAVLLGERELEEGTVTVRRMHDGRQQSVPATDLAAWISGQA